MVYVPEGTIKVRTTEDGQPLQTGRGAGQAQDVLGIAQLLPDACWRIKRHGHLESPSSKTFPSQASSLWQENAPVQSVVTPSGLAPKHLPNLKHWVSPFPRFLQPGAPWGGLGLYRSEVEAGSG